MKGERLFRILGLVDDDLIEEAASASSAAAFKRRSASWRALGLAACLVLICGLGLWFRAGGLTGGDSGSNAPADSGGGSGNMAQKPGAAAGDGASGGGHGEGTVFLSYAGPAFPLTTLEADTGLTAERTLTWDFAPGVCEDGALRQWGAEVRDRYVLSNPTGEDITVTALYPFAGSFSSLPEIRSAVTVDGGETRTELRAGPYAGGFSSAYGAEDPEHDSLNLAHLNSWEGYRTLLEDGAYLRQALEAYPTLDIPVTVYRFSDFAAPHDQYPAATQAVTFTIDPGTTEILSCGFNGQAWDEETGWRQYDYFVPDGVRREPESKVLVVLGADIGDYALQGYENGGCDAGEEIEGVSCAVTREETTLDAVLDDLCREYESFYTRGLAADQDNPFAAVPFEMYRGAVAELLNQHGTLSDAPRDRYADGRLDEILYEVLIHQRVLYLEFPVTVPAGGNVTVECRTWKAPSYDFQCSGSENAGLQGYDLVTRLGSSLDFTRQTAAVENAEGIEIVRQNLGLDLTGGVTAVELDTAEEHYYLELRTAE